MIDTTFDKSNVEFCIVVAETVSARTTWQSGVELTGESSTIAEGYQNVSRCWAYRCLSRNVVAKIKVGHLSLVLYYIA
jgi:hypothetical protein